MQPDKQPSYSIDYLDQISTPTSKPGMSDKLLPIVLIAGVLIALLVGAAALLSSGTSNKTSLIRLSARLQTLQVISDASKKNVVSGSLRGTNTNLSLLLTTANRDISTQLTANAIDPEKTDARIIASESGDSLKKRLEDARISGYFDRTYAREMSNQLVATIALMKEIDAHTKSTSLKEFLETSEKQLQPIQRQFADFNAATT